ncbi:MAG: hypothetical protein RIR26_2979 [Pseudomonadota bacterium]
MDLKPLLLHRNEYHFEHAAKVRRFLAGPVPPEMVSTYATRKQLESFIARLSASLQVEPSLLTLYHGAEDALFKILSWAAIKRMPVVTTSWGWAEYMRMMQGLELSVKQTPLLSVDNAFLHPAAEFEADLHSMPQPSLVLLATPNNPTGHKVAREEVLRLARLFPQNIFLLDQVYNSFSPETFVPLTNAPNIISLGSFSKFFGLPGVRCGFAVGHVPSVQAMSLGPGPWSLELCLSALEEHDYYKRNWDLMKQASKNLQAWQSRCGYFMKTEAPFVLFRCQKGLNTSDIQGAQEQTGVQGKVIRAQEDNYVRWSLGSPRAEEKIKECLLWMEKNSSC